MEDLSIQSALAVYVRRISVSMSAALLAVAVNCVGRGAVVPASLQGPACAPMAFAVDFTPSTTGLSARALRTVDLVVRILDENPSLSVWLIGEPHAASQLQQVARLQAVREELVDEGVEPGRILALPRPDARATARVGCARRDRLRLWVSVL